MAYLLAKPTAKFLKTSLNIPLVLGFSVLPDIDILVPSLHRGPSHSLISALVIFVPFFILYRQKALPYFLALISHSMIGDFLIGGQVQLLWPLSQNKYGNYWLFTRITDPANIAIELTLFTVATIVMFKTRDLFLFFKSAWSNLILAIPILTVLLPTFAGYPLEVPILLVGPHLFYLAVFSISALVAIFGLLKR